MIEIKFETENATFKDDYSKAVNYVLLQVQDLVNMIEEEKIIPPLTVTLKDSNGNSIGTAKVVI